MRTLAYIQRQLGHAKVLQRNVQGLANATAVGIISCSGFGGRCKEWSVLTRQHLETQVEKGNDRMICRSHETSHLYGDFPKWLAPGTVEAMRVCLQLPRRSEVVTFSQTLGDAQLVDVHCSLKPFTNKFLPDNREAPTVNLMRKWIPHSAREDDPQRRDAVADDDV